jgi:hypothetical protein
MAKEIDYKIKSFNLSQNGISCDVRLYRGEVTTEQEDVVGEDTPQDVTRYRREAMLKDINVSLDPQQVQALFRKFLNKRIKVEAADRGLTIISEQDETSV